MLKVMILAPLLGCRPVIIHIASNSHEHGPVWLRGNIVPQSHQYFLPVPTRKLLNNYVEKKMWTHHHLEMPTDGARSGRCDERILSSASPSFIQRRQEVVAMAIVSGASVAIAMRINQGIGGRRANAAACRSRR